MRYPEDELIGILKKNKVDFTCSLPCEKIKSLLDKLPENFVHIPLTREEEGVGICAGAALSGKRPAIFVQSSGTGNMINALLSLTWFYELPLAIFISQRGIYKERIAAQFPMGRRLPGILKGAGIAYSVIGTRDDFKVISKKLGNSYKTGRIHAFLLSPKIWEGSGATISQQSAASSRQSEFRIQNSGVRSVPELTRFDILNIVAPYLDSRVVVCNLGIPSKELFYIKPQPSNFYMLGSMGMAGPIGLGIALTSKKEVVVIDGDGSVLMNPGTLATVAETSPKNLTILAIDNGAYSSTGNQPTATSDVVDLSQVAAGFGIKNTIRATSKKEILKALKSKSSGPRFIHILAKVGNKDVPNIPLGPYEIKKQVMRFLKSKGSAK